MGGLNPWWNLLLKKFRRAAARLYPIAFHQNQRSNKVKFSYIQLITAFILFQPAVFSQDLYNRNLLKNNGAEAEKTSPTAGWLNIFKDEVAATGYGSTGGEFDTDWGKDKGYGNNYFRAGVQTSEPRYISQEIDLSSLSGAIDSGIVNFELSGSFGGGKGASSKLEAIFKNKEGRTIGIESTEHVKPGERTTDEPSLYKHTKSSKVPTGTVTVEIYLRFEFVDICTNCSDVAVADNLSVILIRKTN